MKTTKRLISIILCIAMVLSLGAANAFALEIDDTIEWSFEDYWTDTYIYSGTLEEGSQDLEGGNDYNTNRLCYEFTAEKDGYYRITVYEAEIPFVIIADSYTESTASDLADYIWYCDNTENDTERKSYCIYKLSQGTHLVGMRFNIDNPAACEVRIEYIAESITNLTYDESKYQDLVIGYNVHEDDEAFDTDTEYTITFSNGEVLTLNIDNANPLKAIVNTPWTEGENIITVKLPGYEKEITATAYEITHFIKDIEIPNIDDYLITYEWYNGYGYSTFGEGAEEDVIVTYADDTKRTFKYYIDVENCIYNTFITLPGGREIHLDIYQVTDSDSGKRYFEVQIADHTFIREECEIEKVSFINNFSEIGKNIIRYFRWHFEELSWYVGRLKNADNIEDIMYYLGKIFGSDLFELIGNEISEFTNYYI